MFESSEKIRCSTVLLVQYPQIPKAKSLVRHKLADDNYTEWEGIKKKKKSR